MLNDETVIDLTHATKLFPNRPHTSSIWRWCRKGIGGIRLEYIRAGKRMYTSIEAVERFCRALAERDRQSDDSHTMPRPDRGRSDARREREIAKAEAELAAAGV